MERTPSSNVPNLPLRSLSYMPSPRRRKELKKYEGGGAVVNARYEVIHQPCNGSRMTTHAVHPGSMIGGRFICHIPFDHG